MPSLGLAFKLFPSVFPSMDIDLRIPELWMIRTWIASKNVFNDRGWGAGIEGDLEAEDS